MTQAFATRMPRGFSWIWLAIVAVALTPLSVSAQSTTPPGSGQKPLADDPKDEDATPTPTEQVFVDPNAKKALTVFNPLNFAGTALRIGPTGKDRSTIQNMTAKVTNIDPEFLKKYIEFCAAELTKRENLNAILKPPDTLKPLDPASRALEQAVDALNKPLIDAKANDNKEFISAYSRLLFESSLPKLLESNHNYLSRIDAMIVLGSVGYASPAGLDLYINQLKKPDQLIWVKLWAARGLTNAAQGGAVDLEASKANQAAEALIGFLDSDPKLPWPAQMRALEALGSIRVATVSTPRKVDVASVVMRYLANPEAEPMVRAWAAWALGFMKVSGAVSPYNFTLVGHEIGELAVDLGNRIVQDYDEDPVHFDQEKDLTAQLTGLLLFQVCPSFIGQEGVRDSGLLHSSHRNALDARPFLTKVDEKVKAVSLQAYELLRSAGAGNKTARNQLDAKLADLKTYLASTPPKDRRLLPGGPEFKANPAEQVAGAAGH